MILIFISNYNNNELEIGLEVVKQCMERMLPCTIAVSLKDKSKVAYLVERSAQDLPVLILPIDSVEATAGVLERSNVKFEVLINCSNGHSQLMDHLMKVCIQCNIHYVGSGSSGLEEFEIARKLENRALEKSVLLLPNAGFHSAATDCIASQLIQNVDKVNSLRIGFIFNDSIKNIENRNQHIMDTFEASVNSLIRAPRPGFGRIVCVDGNIRRTKIGYRRSTFTVPFVGEDGETIVRKATGYSFPSSDLLTVSKALGKKGPNIEIFFASCSSRTIEICDWMFWSLNLWFVQFFLHSFPNCKFLVIAAARLFLFFNSYIKEIQYKEMKEKQSIVIFGEASDSKNMVKKRISIQTCNCRRFTVVSATAAAENILYKLPRNRQGSGARQRKRKGLSVSSAIFGTDYILKLNGLGPENSKKMKGATTSFSRKNKKLVVVAEV